MWRSSGWRIANFLRLFLTKIDLHLFHTALHVLKLLVLDLRIPLKLNKDLIQQLKEGTRLLECVVPMLNRTNMGQVIGELVRAGTTEVVVWNRLLD